jgi:hypothetical protein
MIAVFALIFYLAVPLCWIVNLFMLLSSDITPWYHSVHTIGLFPPASLFTVWL